MLASGMAAIGTMLGSGIDGVRLGDMRVFGFPVEWAVPTELPVELWLACCRLAWDETIRLCNMAL